MALSHCEHCGSIEGGFREATLEEMKKFEIEQGDEGELENLICDQCGEVGGYQGIPEHDDFDMDR